MNEIIKINYNSEQVTVSARELYGNLNIGKRFSAWFESNSQGFAEGEDYEGAYLEVHSNQYGGVQILQDFQISVDMAKHICLMSRTEQGKLCRQYFIELEKAWNTPEQIFARALKMADRTIASLQSDNKELQSQLDISKDWYSIKRVAALNGVDWKTFDWRKLKQNGKQMGFQVKKIFDANYGEVNTYHRDVWEATYPKYEI